MLLAASTVAGSVPEAINFQGKITSETDDIPSGVSYAIAFEIYDSAAGGGLIWGPQKFSSVPISGGEFNVILGPKDTAGRNISAAFAAKQRFVSIKIAETAGGLDAATPLTPRQAMVSVPYAFRANHADSAVTVEGPNLYVHPGTGHVGVGTHAPDQPLTVHGMIHSTKDGFKFPDGTVQTSAYPIPPTCTGANKLLQWNGSAWICFDAGTYAYTYRVDPYGGCAGAGMDVTVRRRLGGNGNHYEYQVTYKFRSDYSWQGAFTTSSWFTGQQSFNWAHGRDNPGFTIKPGSGLAAPVFERHGCKGNRSGGWGYGAWTIADGQFN